MVVFKYTALFIKFIASNFNEFLEKNGPYMSAAIAFYSFFSLFPLSLALIAVFSVLLGIEGFEERLVQGLKDQIPVLKEQDDEFIRNFFASLESGRAITSYLAAIGLFWASTAVFSSIRKSINSIWGIRKTRPFLQERLMDFTLLFGASFLLLSSFTLSAVLTFITEISAIVFPEAPISNPRLWESLAVIVPPFLTFLVFLILYWWLPNTKLTFRQVWPTALAGTVAFELSKASFILYLRNLSGVTGSIYGGVSAIIVLMAFVYVSSIILLVGAQLTARYAYYLSVQEQKRRNAMLSRNLDRIRSTSSLSGMPLPAPSGASDGQRDERPKVFVPKN